jgi:very-short-patch-repair endonuclease
MLPCMPLSGRRRPHPDGEWRFTSDSPKLDAKSRVAQLASRQTGRVSWRQLRSLDVGEATISDWCRAGYLHPELPRVYAVGHPGRTTASDLTAALLYAGPGAMLSHATAIWWHELLNYPPRQIIVSTPRRIRSRDNIVVHGRRDLKRVWHNGLPATTPTQAIIDFATTRNPDLLRLVLANADYHDALDVDTLARDGCAALRKALAIHQPALARARSDLEILLITFCESQRLPIPETNVYREGWLVDAVWSEERVVVEVDGVKGHRTRAQLERDHQRDLELRAKGYVVLRYTERQLIEEPAAVAADIRRFL